MGRASKRKQQSKAVAMAFLVSLADGGQAALPQFRGEMGRG